MTSVAVPSIDEDIWQDVWDEERAWREEGIDREQMPDPLALDPVFVRLVRNLVPGQAPVLRIGGDSTDRTWWPTPGFVQPAGVAFAITHRWLEVTRALAELGSEELRQVALWKLEGYTNEEIAPRMNGGEGRSLATVERKLKEIRLRWEKEVSR